MRNNPRERLLNLHRRHVKAWEQKNLDHLRDLYSGDAIVFNITPPARFSDFKTFENTLQQYFAKMKELSMLTSNIQIEVHGDVACIPGMQAGKESVCNVGDLVSTPGLHGL